MYNQRRLQFCLIWHIINIISIGFSGLGLGVSIIYLFMDTANIITVTISTLSFTYRYMCGIYLGRFVEELKSESVEVTQRQHTVTFSQDPNPYSNLDEK